MRSLSAVALLLVSLGLPARFCAQLMACPFCVASPTYGEQIKDAQTVLLVRWVSGRTPAADSDDCPVTTYEVVDVLRDDSGDWPPGQSVSLDAFYDGQPGQLFLLIGTIVEEKLDWAFPLEMSEPAFAYLRAMPGGSAPVSERLTYCMRNLEHEDSLIAADAYSEFALVSYEDVVALAAIMPREKLRAWLADPEITNTRVGLYGMMLGLCGSADDERFLEEMVLRDPAEARFGIDGVMAGYLLLSGERGLSVLDETKIANTACLFDETYASLQALRFMWSYAKGRIPEDRLRASLRGMLARQQLAELIIIDLGRWRDWSAMDQLMSLYGHEDFDLLSVRRTIVRYLLAAEKDVPESDEEAPIPEHVQKAREYLEQLRRSDPECVASAERFLFD